MNLWVWISEELQELGLERADDKPKGSVPGVDVSTLGMAVFMGWVERKIILESKLREARLKQAGLERMEPRDTERGAL